MMQWPATQKTLTNLPPLPQQPVMAIALQLTTDIATVKAPTFSDSMSFLPLSRPILFVHNG